MKESADMAVLVERCAREPDRLVRLLVIFDRAHSLHLLRSYPELNALWMVAWDGSPNGSLYKTRVLKRRYPPPSGGRDARGGGSSPSWAVKMMAGIRGVGSVSRLLRLVITPIQQSQVENHACGPSRLIESSTMVHIPTPDQEPAALCEA